MKINNEITVIISAYNEEKNLEQAAKDVISALKNEILKFEIIIIDDGSTDDTAKIAAGLAQKYRNIRVIRNAQNLGLGRSFARAVAQIKTPYLTVFPGDNDMAASSLVPLIKKRHEADLITAYMENDKSRSIGRKAISKFYVSFMNRLFGFKLRYYNGPFVAKTSSIQSLTLRSCGLDIYAETKVRMIKKGYSYKEIPFTHTGRQHGKSKALTFKNIARTTRSIFSLYCELRHKC